MLQTVIAGSSVNDVSFLIVSSTAKFVKMMQLTSDSFLSAWSSQVNFFNFRVMQSDPPPNCIPPIKIVNATEGRLNDIWGGKHKSMDECSKENDTWRFANCYFWFQRAPLELAPLIIPLLRLWLTTPPPAPGFFVLQISSWDFSRPREINVL